MSSPETSPPDRHGLASVKGPHAGTQSTQASQDTVSRAIAQCHAQYSGKGSGQESQGTLEWKEQYKVIQKQRDQISKVSGCGQGEGASGGHDVSTRERGARGDRARESAGRNLSPGLGRAPAGALDARLTIGNLLQPDRKHSSVPQVEPGPFPCPRPGAGQPPMRSGSQNCPAPETPFSTPFNLDGSRELSARPRPPSRHAPRLEAGPRPHVSLPRALRRGLSAQCLSLGGRGLTRPPPAPRGGAYVCPSAPAARGLSGLMSAPHCVCPWGRRPTLPPLFP